jgi:hypothetical protein
MEIEGLEIEGPYDPFEPDPIGAGWNGLNRSTMTLD